MKTKTSIEIANEFDIESHLTDCDISYRGGFFRCNVRELFPNVDDAIMGAAQNYLGGGIAGAIQARAMFTPDELNAKELEIFDALKPRMIQFFYNVNNGGGDDYMQAEVTGADAGGLAAVQRMPVSAY